MLKSQSKKVNKKEFIELLSKELIVSNYKSEIYLDTIILLIKKLLKEDKYLIIRDFGIFEKKLAAKKVYNGGFSEKKKTVPQHYRPKFKAASKFVEDLNTK